MEAAETYGMNSACHTIPTDIILDDATVLLRTDMPEPALLLTSGVRQII